MLRVAVEYLQPGVVIARDIYTDNGRVVLASGVVLTERHIDALKNWGVVSVYVENPMMELPPISPLLAERTRLSTPVPKPPKSTVGNSPFSRLMSHHTCRHHRSQLFAFLLFGNCHLLC